MTILNVFYDVIISRYKKKEITSLHRLSVEFCFYIERLTNTMILIIFIFALRYTLTLSFNFNKMLSMRGFRKKNIGGGGWGPRPIFSRFTVEIL